MTIREPYPGLDVGNTQDQRGLGATLARRCWAAVQVAGLARRQAEACWVESGERWREPSAQTYSSISLRRAYLS